MRLIDADALKENAYMEGGAQSIAEMVVTVSDIDDAPTVDAIPVKFIKEEIKSTKGFYNSNLRRLLDTWAERREE